MSLDSRRVIDRIHAAKEYWAPDAERFTRNSARYLSSNAIAPSATGGEIQSLGRVNWLAINIAQKVSAVAIAVPDFLVIAGDTKQGPDGQPLGDEISSGIVREYLRAVFQANQIARAGRQIVLDRLIGGMGFMASLWTGGGYVAERIAPNDFVADPNVVETGWNDLRYAARRVAIPLDIAAKRYGRVVAERAWEVGNTGNVGDERDRQRYPVKIWVYWDEDEEIEVAEGGENDSEVLLRRPNLYGRVPVRCLLGEPHPTRAWGLSDYDVAYAAYALEEHLQDVVSRQAKDGGGHRWVQDGFVNEEDLAKLLRGENVPFVRISGATPEKAIGFSPNDALNPAVLAAMEYVHRGLMAAQGVTQYDIGLSQDGARFATEAAMIAHRSSARGTLLRREYEELLGYLARDCVAYTSRFGLDPNATTPASEELWFACRAVSEVHVMERSSSWRDPMLEQQQAGQLVTLMMQMFPLSVQLGKPVNPLKALDDLLRAQNRTDIQEYYLPEEQAAAIMQQMAQATDSSRRTPADTVRYSDAPPDVRRQLEAQAGLQPSQMPEPSREEHEIGMQAAKAQAEADTLALTRALDTDMREETEDE